MTQLLHEYVAALLSEKASSISDANDANLALCVLKTAGITLILYRPEILLGQINKVSQTLEAEFDKTGSIKTTKDGIFRLMMARRAIVGWLVLAPAKPSNGECYDAYEILNAAADDKFGPLLYDVAMDIVPGHTIMSDRSSVSIEAERVWNFYQSRRGDVQALPFDDVNDPRTPPKQDDCKLSPDHDALNYAYRGDPNVGISSLKSSHTSFIMDANEILENEVFENKHPNPLDLVIKTGLDFFRHKYANKEGSTQ